VYLVSIPALYFVPDFLKITMVVPIILMNLQQKMVLAILTVASCFSSNPKALFVGCHLWLCVYGTAMDAVCSELDRPRALHRCPSKPTPHPYFSQCLSQCKDVSSSVSCHRFFLVSYLGFQYVIGLRFHRDISNELSLVWLICYSYFLKHLSSLATGMLHASWFILAWITLQLQIAVIRLQLLLSVCWVRSTWYSS
jgi:hypothetical protein